jgi:hypothetical protein
VRLGLVLLSLNLNLAFHLKTEEAQQEQTYLALLEAGLEQELLLLLGNLLELVPF